MGAARLHVGQVGAELLASVTDQDGAVVDISTATSKLLYLERPDGTVLAPLALSFSTDGQNCQAYYLTLAGTLDMAGPWLAQAKITLADGEVCPTSVEQFLVDPNLY